MDLKNRVAVITGATGGLGSTVTLTFAAHGANLALLDIDPVKLESLAKSLSLSESRLFTRNVNLLDPAQAKSAAEAVAARFGRIDILLHLIGGRTGGKTLVEPSADELSFMLNQHIWTSFDVIQAFVPHLIRNGWGRVVMITSPYAARPKARGGLFAVGKAGQEALMLTLSQELKGTGVTANLLQAMTIDIKREKIANPCPDNSNWTTPEELTSAIIYLLSDDAATINGAKIPMFGSF